MIFTAASSRSSRFRILLALLVAVVIAGMMALWMSVPAHADPTQVSFELKLVNKSGAVLNNYDVYPIEIQDGTAVAFQDSDPATPHVAKPGYYDMTLDSGADYTLFLVPNGSSANSGTSQYLGGTPTLDHAATFTPTANNTFLTASIATGGTISGKVTSPSGGALKNAVVSKFEYDGTRWVSNDYTTTSSTGAYTFTNVDPGSYKFEFYAPTGQYPPIYSGSAKTLDSATPTFVAAGATATVNQKFIAGTGSISGTAYLYTSDEGNEYYDGKLTPEAFPVTSSVGDDTTIDTDKGVSGSPSSSSKGTWAIKNLPAGRYVVQMQPYYSGEYVEYLSGEDDVDSAALSDAAIYTVTAGKTTKTGVTEFDGREDSFGAEPHVTVTDGTSHSAVPGALVQLAPDTSPGSYVYGTASSNGSVQLLYDEQDTVATSDDADTFSNTNFPLYPGWYEITVVDPTGAHEPFTQHTFLDFGVTNIAAALALTTVTPAVDAGSLQNAGSTQIGTTYTVDGASSARDDASLSYQWLRGGKAIYGATTTSYTATGGDLGKQLSVRVTASSFGYADVSQTLYVGGSSGNPETLGDQITNDVAPSIAVTTDPKAGDTVSANVGTWLIDGEPATGLTFTYQWVFTDGPETTTIEGATGPTYTTTSAEIGGVLTVIVQAHKTGYVTSDSVYSSNTPNVESQPAPVNTKAPKVTTTTKNGVTTYTVSNGSWNQTGLSFSYTWKANGEIVGQFLSSSNSTTSTAITAAAGPGPYAGPIAATVVASKGGNDPGLAIAIAVPGTDVPSQTSPPTVVDVTAESTPVSDDAVVSLGDQLKVSSPGSWSVTNGTIDLATEKYQWYRNGVAIKGATKSTYTVASADTSVDGSTELSLTETITSSFYAGSQTSQQTPIARVVNQGFPGEPTATLSGPATVGVPVKVTVVGWGVSGVGLTYTWWGCATPCADEGDGDAYVQIPGANKSSLTLKASDAYDFVGAEVTGYKAGYGQQVVDSVAVPVYPAGSYYPTSGIHFSGTPAVGKTLTATTPKWSLPGVKDHYYWQVQACDPSSCDADDWTPVPANVSKSTYTITAADYAAGNVSIRLEDLATLGSGDSQQAFSAPQAIDAGTLTVKTAPKIAVSGGNYVVTGGTYSVANGTHDVIVYKDDDGADGASRATDPSDAGKAIYATDTYTVTGYNPLTTTVVYQKGSTEDFAEAINGDAVVGATVTASDPAPFENAQNLAYVPTYQWYSNGTAVSGAAGKGTSFVVTSAYYGKKLTLKVTGTNALYATGTVTSAAVTVGKGSFGDPNDPVITSSTTLEAGVKASVTLGSYNASSVTFAYKWLRSTDGGTTFTPISGATKSTYTPVATDGGDQLEVTVTATKTDYTPSTLTSDPVLIHYPTDLAALAPPALTGSGKVGDLLTVSQGVWNVPSLTYSYVWYRNGVAIPGVTGTTWTPTATSSGDEITVKVTASRSGYATVAATSSAVSVVDSDALQNVTLPVITNNNGMLTVSPGAWTLDGLTISYDWVTGGHGPTGDYTETYAITGSEEGGLGVDVTVERDGYEPQSVYIAYSAG